MKQIRANRNLIIALFCGASLIVGAVGLAQRGVDRAAVSARDTHELSSVFREVAKEALPSVVSIETVGKARNVRRDVQLPFNDDKFPFRGFFKNDPRFRDLFENRIPHNLPRPHGKGSGFIIDSSGVVMTNSHVVNDAEQVKIKLQDGREFIASDVKTDPRSDVAIVRFNAPDGLPALRMGDSKAMQIGDWVLAMGSPFGLDGTVTAGIISASGRGPGIASREDFLQTDAAINPGNSGGPLLNLNGEVIGINTAISTRSGGYDGIGFAIPINMAQWVSHQLLQAGEVKRAFLGVTIQSVDYDLARQFQVKVGQGAIVSSVLPDSPAANAGIQTGDVILELNGEKVFSSRNLQGLVEKLTIGKKYEMLILRDGKRQTIDVTVREMPVDNPIANRDKQSERQPQVAPKDEEFSELGIDVQPLTEELAKKFGVDGESGVLVSSVKPDTPAYEAGLRSGSIIKRVGRQDVKSVEEFRQTVKSESLKDGILLLVQHPNGGRGFVVVRAE